MRDSLDKHLAVNDLVKMIALYEVYGLYDCAMEAIKNSQGVLKNLIPVEDICSSLITSSNERETRSRNLPKKGLHRTRILSILRRLGLRK